jgi:hypothetical protein
MMKQHPPATAGSLLAPAAIRSAWEMNDLLKP